MPTPIFQLHKWWSSTGFGHLVRLIDTDQVDLKPEHCGFHQAIQRQLCAFDTNRTLLDQLFDDIFDSVSVGTVSSVANTRRALNEVLWHVFRSPEDGGLLQRRALHGLENLEQVEIRRRHLFQAVQNHPNDCYINQNLAHCIRDLDEKSSARYNQFHLGFRTSVCHAFTHVATHVLIKSSRPSYRS